MTTVLISIVVLSGKSLIAKNGTKSDPYCEVTILDDSGNKLGKTLYTKVMKGELSPEWNQMLELYVVSIYLKTTIYEHRLMI